MAVRGIRGATTVDENTEIEIKNATVELINKIIEENNINLEDIVYTQFSTTKDLNTAYPAKFARLNCGFTSVPMMSSNEQEVLGSLKMALRVLIVVNTDKKQNEMKHQYLKGAKVLRPDIKWKKNL